MFVRLDRFGSRKYMKVVESIRVDGQVRTRYLCALGPYDEEIWDRAREWVRDLVVMEQGQVMISELQEVPIWAKAKHFGKFSVSRGR